MAIPDHVRRFAEDPAAFGEVNRESGLTRVLTDRYCLLLGPVPTFTSVSRLRLAPDEVAETLAEIRDLVAVQGHSGATWSIGSSATPVDLVDRLVSHGLMPDERPAREPHAAALVLVAEPPPGPAEVVAARVTSFEEFRTATMLAYDAFDVPVREIAEWDAIADEIWQAERAGAAPRVYLARLDGEPVGVGRAVVDPRAPAVLGFRSVAELEILVDL